MYINKTIKLKINNTKVMTQRLDRMSNDITIPDDQPNIVRIRPT